MKKGQFFLKTQQNNEKMFFLAVFLFSFCAATILQNVFNALFSDSNNENNQKYHRHSGYVRHDSDSYSTSYRSNSNQSNPKRRCRRSSNGGNGATGESDDENVENVETESTLPESGSQNTNAAIARQISEFVNDQGWTVPVYPFFRTESKNVSVIGRKRTIVTHRIVDRIIVGVYRVGENNTLHVAFAVDRNDAFTGNDNPFVYNRSYKKQIRSRLLETALVRLARNPVVVSIDDNLAKAVSTVDTSNKTEIVRFDKNAIVPLLRKIMMNYTSSRYSIVSNISVQPVWNRPNRKDKSTFTKLGEGPFVGSFSLIESPL